jgi:hypothetical protein
MYDLIWIVLIVGLLASPFLLKVLVTWLFRIDESIANQERIIALLEERERERVA